MIKERVQGIDYVNSMCMMLQVSHAHLQLLVSSAWPNLISWPKKLSVCLPCIRLAILVKARSQELNLLPP